MLNVFSDHWRIHWGINGGGSWGQWGGSIGWEVNVAGPLGDQWGGSIGGSSSLIFITVHVSLPYIFSAPPIFRYVPLFLLCAPHFWDLGSAPAISDLYFLGYLSILICIWDSIDSICFHKIMNCCILKIKNMEINVTLNWKYLPAVVTVVMTVAKCYSLIKQPF